MGVYLTMKKIFIISLILLFILTLSGCSSVDEQSEEVFSINEKQKKEYDNIISAQLTECMWNYIEEDTTYEKGSIETKDSSRYNDIYNASLDMGFDIKAYEGRDAVIVSTKILYFNNEEAGQAYFYFIKDKLVSEYYIKDEKIYSLKVNNVFITENEFIKFEDLNIKAEFTEKEINNLFNDYNDISTNKGTIATIDDDYRLLFYNYGKSFYLNKRVSFENEGLFPIDTAFFENGDCAVLLGKENVVYTNTESSSGNTDSFEEDLSLTEKSKSLKSYKVSFLDRNLKIKNESIELPLSTYTDIKVNNGNLFILRDKTIDVYKKENSSWNKTNQIMLKHWANKMKIADIDENGTNEIILTDGMDLFVYKLDDTLELIWKTNLSIKSMSDIMYVEDLNGDGVKEIYIMDLSGTTARYILTKDGFKAYSDDIEYGQKFIPGDFNNNGKTDYVSINTIDKTSKLYLRK